MTKVAILDDEIIICETLGKYLSELGYVVVGYALEYQEAVELLNEKQPDIFLLDINLGGSLSGKDFAAYIRTNADIPLIFISSYSDKQTLESVKEFLPDGYLVKPFAKNDLFTAIEIAVNKFNSRQLELKKKVDSFFVRHDAFYVKIKFSDLSYLKTDGTYVELYTTAGKKYLHRDSLKNMLDLLPDYFVQIHRAYAVNTQAVEAVNRENVMIAGETLPVGETFVKDLFQRLDFV